MMKKIILALPFLSLLTACEPPMTREEELAIYRNRCLDYGYQWGSPEFADCMMQQESQERELSIQEQKVQALQEKNRIKRQEVWDKEWDRTRKRERNRKDRKKSKR